MQARHAMAHAPGAFTSHSSHRKGAARCQLFPGHCLFYSARATHPGSTLAREQGSPKWAALLATLPGAVESPVLWPDQQRSELLRGSPVRLTCLFAPRVFSHACPCKV